MEATHLKMQEIKQRKRKRDNISFDAKNLCIFILFSSSSFDDVNLVVGKRRLGEGAQRLDHGFFHCTQPDLASGNDKTKNIKEKKKKRRRKRQVRERGKNDKVKAFFFCAAWKGCWVGYLDVATGLEALGQGDRLALGGDHAEDVVCELCLSILRSGGGSESVGKAEMTACALCSACGSERVREFTSISHLLSLAKAELLNGIKALAHVRLHSLRISRLRRIKEEEEEKIEKNREENQQGLVRWLLIVSTCERISRSSSLERK
jgi:hypothetical protein